MPYIIDGSNLLRAIESDDERFEPVDQYRLCWTLSRFLGRISEQGQLIYDGTGPQDKQRLDNIHNLEVCFAGPRSDTDTVIEEIIKASANPKDLVIVSSDRRLRRAAVQRRAQALRSEVFWETVLKEMQKKRAPSEPTSKRHGLSESETEHWLDVFDIDTDKG
jgi:predicted RNA-binding protein with PIN domain